MLRRFTSIDAPGLRCKNMRYSAAPHFDSPGADGAGLKVTQVRRRINAGEINPICRRRDVPQPSAAEKKLPGCLQTDRRHGRNAGTRLQRPPRRLCCSEGAPLGRAERTHEPTCGGKRLDRRRRLTGAVCPEPELTGSGLQLGDNMTAPS